MPEKTTTPSAAPAHGLLMTSSSVTEALNFTKPRLNWISVGQSLLFSTTLFLSAALLFSIQPMLAKSLLPVYGGAPAVWTVCMLFFQVILLAGYGYAWLLSCLAKKNLGRKGVGENRLWRLLHLGLIISILSYLISFPFQFNPEQITALAPDQAILGNLTQQIGLLVLLLASSSPLLQFIYSQTKSKSARDPYFLFVASNAGSLLALLSYPFLIERYFGLREQFHYWTRCYLIYLVLVGILVGLSMSAPSVRHDEAMMFDTPSWRSRMVWMCYGFIPCSLMLGMTFYITTDVAATPMLWIVPLTVYLLSFMLSFVKKPLVSQAWLLQNVLFFMIFIMLCFIFGTNSFRIGELFFIHLSTLGLFCLIFNSELYRLRPPVNQLTNFYCYMALGGVLAGVFNGVIAPHLFSGAYEYPLVLWLAMLLLPKNEHKMHFNWTPLFVASLLLMNFIVSSQREMVGSGMIWSQSHHVFEVIGLLAMVLWPGNRFNLALSLGPLLVVALLNSGLKDGLVLVQKRNFYGIKQVVKLADAHALLSHTTVHGFQLPGETRKTNSQLAYYSSPFRVVQQLQKLNPQLRATIIGLGAGTMACQFRETDLVDMIEIDSQMTKIAKDPRYFTFLRDCAPKAKLITGDGRQVVRRIQDASRDLLVMDAFNSDAVPTHLLTQEAIELFATKLTADGVILVNISNRHINLLPVLVASAQQLEKIILYKLDQGDTRLGQFPSAWALLTSNDALASQMMRAGWHFAADSEALLWTDDYSNVLPLIKWHIGA